jgi:hypothetical protein
MKLLKVVLGLAVAVGLFAPAMASPSVTFDGNAKVRFGSQYVRVDGNDDAAMMFMADQRMDQRQAYFYGVMFAAHALKDTLVSFIGYETPSGFMSNSADTFKTDLQKYMEAYIAKSADGGTFAAIYQGFIAMGSTSRQATDATTAAMFGGNPKLATGAANFIAGSQVSILALTNSLTTIQTSWKKVGINGNNLAKYLDGSNRKKDSQSFWFGLKNKQDVRLNTNIKDERLTAKVSVDYQASTPRYDTKTTPSLECKEAWVAYDFGPLKVTYATVGAQGRWDGDIYDIGDGYSAEGSLDFIIKPFANAGNVFVTLISDHSAEKAKYEVFNNRILPITQLGYEINNDIIDFKAGGVLDWYKGSDSSTGAYKGWMAFASATYKIGKIGELAPGSMAFGFAGAYGQNVDKFAGMNPDDTDCLVLSVVTKQDNNLHRNTDCHGDKRDAQVRGVHAYSAVRLWEGALFYSGWYMSQARFVGVNPYDSADFIDYKWMTAYKMEFALIQFFSKNFNVKVATGYESYSLRPHSNYGVIPLFDPDPKLGGWGFETLVEAEFLF